MNITIEIIKRFTKSCVSDKDTFMIDLDLPDNSILKRDSEKNSDEYKLRFDIICKLVFANRMKRILIYTEDIRTILPIIEELVVEIRKTVVIPEEKKSYGFITNLLTTPFTDKVHLGDGLIRATADCKDSSGKRQTIVVEYFEHSNT